MAGEDKVPRAGATEVGSLVADHPREEQPGKDVHISFGQSPIVSPFMEAAAKGRPLDPAWVSSPVAKPTLKGALIASAQLSASGEAVSATINFETVEHDFVRH